MNIKPLKQQIEHAVITEMRLRRSTSSTGIKSTLPEGISSKWGTGASPGDPWGPHEELVALSPRPPTSRDIALMDEVISWILRADLTPAERLTIHLRALPVRSLNDRRMRPTYATLGRRFGWGSERNVRRRYKIALNKILDAAPHVVV